MTTGSSTKQFGLLIKDGRVYLSDGSTVSLSDGSSTSVLMANIDSRIKLKKKQGE